MSALLETHRLRVSIAGQSVCSALNLALEDGQCWGLLGANGAGKTTLLHTLAGLRPPEAGEILLNGVPLANQNRRVISRSIGVQFQETSDAFPSTVLETALVGRHPYLHLWEAEQPADYALARSALASLELGAMENRPLHTLSGGERRRAALATVLTQDPPLMLLDEPLNHLDMHRQIRMLELVRDKLRRPGRAVLMSLHDVNMAVRFCDRVLLLTGYGETISGPTRSVLNEDSLEKLYRHPVHRLDGPDGPVFTPA